MVRAMIVLLLLGSCFLGWNYMRQAKILETYEKTLAPGDDVEGYVTQTQARAHDYALALKQAEDENVDATRDEGVILRIRKVAQSDSVKWGGLYKSKERTKGQTVDGKKYEDTTYSIRHEDNKHTVSRQRIAHLFYLLEGLRNLHVTRIDISQAKAPKPGDIPVDEWKCDFDVVERKPVKKNRS